LDSKASAAHVDIHFAKWFRDLMAIIKEHKELEATTPGVGNIHEWEWEWEAPVSGNIHEWETSMSGNGNGNEPPVETPSSATSSRSGNRMPGEKFPREYEDSNWRYYVRDKSPSVIKAV